MPSWVKQVWRFIQFLWNAEGTRQQFWTVLEYLGLGGYVSAIIAAVVTAAVGQLSQISPWQYLPLSACVFFLIALGFCLFEAARAFRRMSVVDRSLGQRSPILPKSSSAERDVWLSEAIDRAFLGEWGKPRTTSIFEADPNSGERHLNTILNDIQQFARDGKLPVWGKAARHRAWDPIPPEFWSTGRLDIFSYLRAGADPSKCQSEDNQHFDPRRFLELKTSAQKVDELWPIY